MSKEYTLITGASRGIGRQIALELGKKGYNLIVHSRSEKNIQGLHAELSKFDIDVKRVSAELSNQEAVKNMLNQIDAMGLEVNHVFNNAGVQIAYRNDYFDTPEEDFTMSFSINTIAPVMICYHFLPKMLKKGFGRIINTSSGIKNEPQQAGYSASKAALDKLTIDLANSLKGSGVTINLTDPGWCRTDLGGPQAPNLVESTLPGMILPLFLEEANGEMFEAQDYSGLSLEEAMEKYKHKKHK
jgi:short-subunit dehydrogenase